MSDRNRIDHHSAAAHQGGCLLCGYSPCTCLEDADLEMQYYPDVSADALVAMERAISGYGEERCVVCDAVLTDAEIGNGNYCRRHRRPNQRRSFSPWTSRIAVVRTVARDWAYQTYVGCPGETDYGTEICCECGGSAVRPIYVGNSTFCSQDCLEQHHGRKGEVA